MDVKAFEPLKLFYIKKALAIAAQVIDDMPEGSEKITGSQPMKELLDDLCGGNAYMMADYARLANECLGKKP